MRFRYLHVLEADGAREPHKHVVVIAGSEFANVIMRKGAPFSEAQTKRLRAFAARSSYRVLYDPYATAAAGADDPTFHAFAHAAPPERARLAARLGHDLAPVGDDRPYFYWLRPRDSLRLDGGGVFPVASLRLLFPCAAALCALLFVAPVLVLRRRGQRVAPAVRALPFFAATGLGFILAENALFMQLMLFVGGPLYSLAVVLPGVLIGYSVGSVAAPRLVPPTTSGAIALGVAYGGGFGVCAVLVTQVLPSLVGVAMPARMAVALALVAPFGLLLGLAVPWRMERLKSEPATAASLPWMWAASAASNVLGSLAFVPLGHALGIRSVFALGGLLYVVAMLGAAQALRARGSPRPALE